MSERIEALEVVEGKHTVRVHYGERTHEIAISAAETLGLTVGLAVTAALEAQIEAAADRRTAAARVLRHLRGRPRTASEVRVYLARHGHAAGTIDYVLRELESRGLVDDVRYAEWFVGGRLAHRPLGAVRLVRDLCARGVARPVAENAARNGVGDREMDLAMAAARPKFVAAQRLGRERGLRRLAGFLAARGFNDAVVREVCLRMFAGEPAAPRRVFEARPAQKAGLWRRRPSVSEET